MSWISPYDLNSTTMYKCRSKGQPPAVLAGLYYIQNIQSHLETIWLNHPHERFEWSLTFYCWQSCLKSFWGIWDLAKEYVYHLIIKINLITLVCTAMILSPHWLCHRSYQYMGWSWRVLSHITSQSHSLALERHHKRIFMTWLLMAFADPSWMTATHPACDANSVSHYAPSSHIHAHLHNWLMRPWQF